MCNNPGCYDQSLFYYTLELFNPINFSDWAERKAPPNKNLSKTEHPQAKLES